MLAKAATPYDPGRVINISSVAGFLSTATGSKLASGSNGLWSCASLALSTPEASPHRPPRV